LLSMALKCFSVMGYLAIELSGLKDSPRCNTLLAIIQQILRIFQPLILD